MEATDKAGRKGEGRGVAGGQVLPYPPSRWCQLHALAVRLHPAWMSWLPLLRPEHQAHVVL